MNNRNSFSENIITSIDYLPLITKTNFDIHNILNDNELTPKKLTEIIIREHSLAARILALANSDAYGFSKKISTIEMAISVLGIQTVKDLVIGFSIINSTLEDNDRYFIADAFNKHSYTCGYVAQLLANDFNYPVKNEAFIAGLLHDIGIAVIHRYMNNEFKLISELKFYRKINQTKAEILILGKNHCDIGAAVAEKWNFPNSLIDAIKYHHSPVKNDANPLSKKLIAIVHLADYIASKEAPQYLLSSEDEPFNESIIEILNIPDVSFLYDVINNISDLIKVIKTT